MGTPTWDHAAFYREVVARAKALGIADSTQALATKLGISHSMLSKWYRGHERPSTKSLQKLSDVLTLPEERAKRKSAYPTLMVLAGHLQPHEVGMAEAPAPPPIVERDPLVFELEHLLSDTSKLTAEEKDVLRGLVDRVLVGWRVERRGRRRSA